MAKKKFKVMALSTLITTVTIGNFIPTYTVAAESIKNPIHESASNQYKGYELSPNGMKEALEKTKSNALVMDLYALTILKQAKINLNNIPSINADLKMQISIQQDVSQKNAREWLDVLKPKMILTNENIINYDNKFDGYCDTLVKAANAGNKTTLAKGLERLSTSISSNKKEVDELIGSLKGFRDKITDDTRKFKSQADEVKSILISEDAGIPSLEKSIDALNIVIDEQNKAIIGWSVGAAIGPIMLVSGALLVGSGAGIFITGGLIVGGAVLTGISGAYLAKSQENIDNARSNIKKQTQQLTNSKIQLVYLKDVQNQLENQYKTIDTAIESLQKISDHWDVMSSKYTILIKDIKDIPTEDLMFIKEDLEVARKNWREIKEKAIIFYNSDIKKVENNS
ncbi:enterotoxin [Bacillus thuringiensis]|uniref:Enterotoxin n=1 Tax=Bacillus thuringiensis TaxID=1428 RepID=A0A9X7AUC6_BACTU|nr:HBL/NHE enterotoxin family protein [Bacillus thuringiensis]PFT74457.1 enterotoxin [Bacillus thuringiensis]